MKFNHIILSILFLGFTLSFSEEAHSAGMKTCWHLKNGVREIEPFAVRPTFSPCPTPIHDENGNVMPPPGRSALKGKKGNPYQVKHDPGAHHCTYDELDGGMH